MIEYYQRNENGRNIYLSFTNVNVSQYIAAIGTAYEKDIIYVLKMLLSEKNTSIDFSAIRSAFMKWGNNVSI